MEEKTRNLLLAAAVFLLALAALLWFLGEVEKRANVVVPANSTELAARYYAGPSNASVTLIEFGDFQCSYCGQEEPVLKRLRAEFPNLRFGYMHLPVPRLHAHAIDAAMASECAAEQGKFWEYHDKLFENQQALDNSSLKLYADQLGLNASQFNSCFESGEKRAVVEADAEKGRRLSPPVTGTPTFFINGRRIDGAAPYEYLRDIINAETSR